MRVWVWLEGGEDVTVGVREGECEDDDELVEEVVRLVLGRFLDDAFFALTVSFLVAVGVACSSVESSSSSSGESPRFELALTSSFVLNTGLPLFPFPSFEGLPGAPSGNCSLTDFGIDRLQLAQVSDETLSPAPAPLPPNLPSPSPKYDSDVCD